MTNLQTKPKLTTGQLRILTHIYRFRFLTSMQIQQLMKHKNRARINIWLRGLRDIGFITWHYDHEAGQNMKPAICSLSPEGAKYLKLLSLYPAAGLSLRRRDKDRSPAFVQKCIMLANISISLRHTNKPDTSYQMLNASDWETAGPNLEFIRQLAPDLWITRTYGQEQTDFLLEIFDPTLPAYMVKKRIRDYIDCHAEDEWHEQINTPFPTVLFVCPTLARLIYAKRTARRLLAQDADPDDLALGFTTFDKLRAQSISADIWEPA